MSAVEEYDPVSDSWDRRFNLPTGRGGHTAAVIDDTIYVICGSTAHTWLEAGQGEGIINSVEVFNPGNGYPTMVEISTPN